MAPQRLLDTRGGGAEWTPVTGGGAVLALPLFTAVPAGSEGVVMNVTGIAPTTPTYVSVYPKSRATPTRPSTSNLNLSANQTVPNLVSVSAGPDTEVWLYNDAGSINLIADLAGYFVP
jgi:hypothetical protein